MSTHMHMAKNGVRNELRYVGPTWKHATPPISCAVGDSGVELLTEAEFEYLSKQYNFAADPWVRSFAFARVSPFSTDLRARCC